MDPKITILLMLIGSIITLSHLSDGTFDRARRQFSRLHFGRRQWRDLVPSLRRF